MKKQMEEAPLLSHDRHYCFQNMDATESRRSGVAWPASLFGMCEVRMGIDDCDVRWLASLFLGSRGWLAFGLANIDKFVNLQSSKIHKVENYTGLKVGCYALIAAIWNNKP